MKTAIQITTFACMLSLCEDSLPARAQTVPPAQATVSSADQLLQARFFEEPLVWVGAAAPTESESQALCGALALGQLKPLDQCLDDLEAFLGNNPSSPWAASLHANLGQWYFQNGYYTLALSHFETAWGATKALTDQAGRRVADFTLVNWLQLLSSLGRTDTLQGLFDSTKLRTISVGSFAERYGQSHAAYSFMLAHPDRSYRCGTFALTAVASYLSGTNTFGDFLNQPSPATGFSMADLANLATTHNLDLVAADRSGGQEIIVPSVVHWQQNHYAAIVAQNGGLYQVVDPTFLLSKWLTAKAINTECSGQFLVSAKQMPATWRVLTTAEAAQIFGKGYPSAWDNPPGPPCTNNCDCAPGSNGSGPGGGSGGGSGGGPGSGCGGCGQGAATGGMPNWRIVEPGIDLWVIDEPLAYQPATGPRISAQIFYEQHSAATLDAHVFGLGPSWGFAWFSYFDIVNQVLYPAGGGQRPCTNVTGTVSDYYTQTRMKQITNGLGAVVAYDLLYPSGAMDVYGFLRKTSGGTLWQAYLTQQINPQGRTTTLSYAPYDPVTNNVVVLNYVVDADGQTNTLSYTSVTNVCNYLISKIVDPYHRTNSFLYHTNGYLTNVVDVAGYSSSFGYGYGGVSNLPMYWLTNLTTPYGVTGFFPFAQPAVGNGVINRATVVTEPDGNRELFLYGGDPLSGIPTVYTNLSNVPTNPPTGSVLDNPDWNNPNADDYMANANSFYWNRQQFPNLSSSFLASFTMSGYTNWDFTQLTNTDFANGRLRHWNTDASFVQGDNLGMERDPSPDDVTTGKMIWYDYPNRNPYNTFTQGSNALPSLAIKVLPDGTEWYEQYQMDAWGNRTNVIATYTSGANVLTRSNQFVFAANGADLLQAIGPDGITNAAYAYTNHLVAFMTNALGQVTSCTYNTNTWQLTSMTRPTLTATTGLITTNLYATNGWLTSTYDYAVVGGTNIYFRTNAFTYTNGLVLTHTDERGLTTTNTWDNLQRLTKVAFPDGTSATYAYSNLDLVQITDRLGFVTSYAYNSIRQKVAETNALTNWTHYAYCQCGAPSYITNALGQVTSFGYDYEGQLTLVQYPDGSSVANQYNLVHQLVQRTDGAGASMTNWFNNQGLVAAVSNAFGRVQTMVYDIDDRVVTNVDVNGVSVVTTYDNLGRPLTRTYPDTGVEEFGYSYNGLTAYTNQLGKTNGYVYDAAGRKTSSTDADGQTTQFGYNAANDLSSLVDPLSHQTAWTYNQYGWLTAKLDNNANTIISYVYDAGGRLTNRWMVGPNNTGYAYNPVGNVTSITYSNASPLTVSFAYDILSRLTNMVDKIGTNTYTYTPAGQLLTETETAWASDTVSNSYSQGHRTGLNVTQPSGSWSQTYTFDLAWRMMTNTSPAGSFGYAYDATGHQLVDEISLPDAAYITNTHDSVARTKSTALANQWGHVLDGYSYGYDLAGRRTTLTRNFGLGYNNVAVGYDPAGQIKSWSATEVSGASRLNEQLAYAYDAAGNLNYRTNGALVETFTVGASNQIQSVARTGTLTVSGATPAPATNITVGGVAAQTYSDFTFAATNNTLANGSNTFTVIAQDIHGTSATNALAVNLPTSVAFSYDGNGNLTNDGTRSFVFDVENQLTNVFVAGAWRSDFLYDGLGRRRITRDYSWSGSAWTQTNEIHYVYDGNLVVQERNGSNVVQVTYTRGTDLSGTIQGAGGIGGLLARTDSSGSTFYHADGNGNVTSLTDANENVVARYLYDPFGKLLGLWGTLANANAYRFSSKEFHQNSGLVYYLYRFYDANLQRWPNRDPIGELGGLNLYTILGNSVPNKVDLFGFTDDDGGWWKKRWGDVKTGAGILKQWCKDKMKSNVGTRGPLPASPVSGITTTVGGVVIEAGTGILTAGPGLTTVAIISTGPCAKCNDCRGGSDDDASCDQACAACEALKSKIPKSVK